MDDDKAPDAGTHEVDEIESADLPNPLCEQVRDDEAGFFEDLNGALSELGLSTEDPTDEELELVYIKLAKEGFLKTTKEDLGYIPRPSAHPSRQIK